ncbi:two-component regulator propeller domain-containing protein [Rubrolithibacter danxiaensis]|uniref:two-component regulator propeller domain-containing protein n=1 Tax=Rubrolithibacter danxiaensis TaxID=3390805 RepID=UPI003BF81A37
MRSRNYFLLLLFILLSTAAFSQKPDLQFKHLSTLNGLSHDFARRIIQDHRGYMWIATINGLNKYDGLSVTVYKNNKNNKTSLSSNNVYTVMEDSYKNLWVGTTIGLDLYRRDTDDFLHYPLENGKFIERIYEDQKKNIWVASGNKLYLFDRKKRTFTVFASEGLNETGAILCMFEDKAGAFWVGGFHGLWKLDRVTKKAQKVREIGSKPITAIFEDNENKFWIASREDGLFLYNRKTASFIHFKHNPRDPNSIPTNVILRVAEDPSGNLWLGSENEGLIIYDKKYNLFYNYKHSSLDNETINSNTIYSIYRGRNNEMWLSTFSGGVELAEPRRFHHIKNDPLNPKSLSDNNVSFLYEDSKGNFWVGTDGGGLNLYNRKTGTAVRFKHDPDNPKSLSTNIITFILEDHKKQLWIGHWGGGLDLYDEKKNQFIHFRSNPKNTKESLLFNNVIDLYEDKKNNLWVGTSSGLDLFDTNTNKFTHYSLPENGLKTFITDILEDRDNNLWIGGFGGLYLLDRNTKKTSIYRHNDKDSTTLNNSVVNTIFEDSKGNLWVGTVSGLNLMNKKNRTFVSFNNREITEAEAVYGILEDNKNNLWLSTTNGLSKFNPATKTFINYTVSDGLQGNSFKDNSFVKLKSGELAFGGTNGFNIFNPDSIKTNKTVPQVILTDFRIFNKKVPLSEKSPLKKVITETDAITISHKESVISFDFSTISYTNPEKNQFAYKLVGLEKDWNYVGNKRTATYTNLNPGTYYFKVKASNNDGIWNENETTLKITVIPPYWKTWWFRILLTFTLFLIFFLIYKLRIRGIKGQKMALERLVQARTEEIVAQNEQLTEQQEELKKKDEEILSRIAIIQKIADEISEGNYSTRIQAEEKDVLGSLSYTLNRMAASLEESFNKNNELMQKKDEFLSIASHELKTPVTSIKAVIQLIDRATYQNEETRKIYPFISRAKTQVNKLTEIINDLLDVSKINAGKLELKISSFYIEELITETLDGIFSDDKTHEVSIEGDLRVLIKADRFRIEQVLNNLVSNAVKYSPGKNQLFITISSTKKTVKISVKDQGIGIPADKTPFIFERFFRVQESSQNFPGMGLGLYISYEIVKRHGGKMGVESETGKGSTFWFTLPIEE